MDKQAKERKLDKKIGKLIAISKDFNQKIDEPEVQSLQTSQDSSGSQSDSDVD